MKKGERLEKLIKESPYENISRFSKEAGVPYTTLKSMIERDLHKAGVDSLYKIAKKLNVTVDYLIKEEKDNDYVIRETQSDYRIKDRSDNLYNYFPTAISAGLPIEVDGITESEKIAVPDSIMGKWKNHQDLFIVRANGQSMNKTIPDQSLMAVKPIELSNLKNDDIVVYSDNHDYSVKRYYDDVENERIIFRPHSTDRIFIDDIYYYDNLDSIKIHGKVVVYTVELD